MNSAGRRLLGLCLPPLLICALDCGLTLRGQSAAYWEGRYEVVDEASPTFHNLLQVHPAAFVAGMAVWAAIFVAIILLLPDALALIASIAVTIGHMAGATSWLRFRFQASYQTCNLLFAVCSILLGLGIYYGWRGRPAEPYRLGGLSLAVRWVIALSLVAIAVYLFLWPRKP